MIFYENACIFFYLRNTKSRGYEAISNRSLLPPSFQLQAFFTVYRSLFTVHRSLFTVHRANNTFKQN